MKKDLALTLVDHWKKNSKLIEVPGLAAYMKAQGSYFPPNIPTKIWIGTYNRLASAALWDGHFNRAVGLLMKHGLKDKSSIARPPKLNGTYMGSRRLSGDTRNPGSDWKYVK